MKDIRTRLHEADTSLCLWVSCESIPELRVWGTREGFLENSKVKNYMILHSW